MRVGGGLAQGQGAGGPEGGVGGVHGVRLAVPQDDPEVDERVPGGDAPGGLGADALLDGGELGTPRGRRPYGLRGARTVPVPRRDYDGRGGC
ncbi:hypothetical protein JCM13580A_54630 [Streptomyces drozdowiczii]